MILRSKHVGAILNVLIYYVCALVGVLIKRLYEMHGATIKMISATYSFKFFYITAQTAARRPRIFLPSIIRCAKAGVVNARFLQLQKAQQHKKFVSRRFSCAS